MPTQLEPAAPVAAISIRRAAPDDLDALQRLESLCFKTDKLSRRSFKRWLRHNGCVFLVSQQGEQVCGYVLVILRRGTRLARLYSVAVDPACRGRGLAAALIDQAEHESRDAGALYMRLEVAGNNDSAIELYHRLGYLQFGMHRDYYEDHSDALRMEKCIRPYEPAGDSRLIPWISQSMEFTCGPAALMMAMIGLDPDYAPSVLEEIQIWREATTIFMTSGHGGCHPLGLALAARQRGFSARAMINQRGPLFLDGVRSQEKKRVMTLVHQAFVSEAEACDVAIDYSEVDQQRLCESFAAGDNVLILISTFRMDSRKTPHWVLLSGYDDSCLYVHDPDLENKLDQDIAVENRDAMDCQHLPIAKEEFAAMSRFGGNRLRAAVIVGKRGD